MMPVKRLSYPGYQMNFRTCFSMTSPQYGSVECAARNCPRTACSNPVEVPGECCPQCIQCIYEGREYENDAPVYSSDPCETCVCRFGEVICARANCPQPQCPNPVEIPGRCCPECPCEWLIFFLQQQEISEIVLVHYFLCRASLLFIVGVDLKFKKILKVFRFIQGVTIKYWIPAWFCRYNLSVF